MGVIKLRDDPGRSDGRDKPVLSLVEGTCWTKPRSSTDVAAMRIVKWRSGAECGALLAIDREVGEGEIDADRFSVMATAQCGLGASSSRRQPRLPGRLPVPTRQTGGQAHPCEEGGLRVKGVYEGVNFAHEESHWGERDIRGRSPTTIIVPFWQRGQRLRSIPVSSRKRSWADLLGIWGKAGSSPNSFRH